MRHNFGLMFFRIRQLAWSTASMKLKECLLSKRNDFLVLIVVLMEKRVRYVLKSTSWDFRLRQ
jgi:hypothetical protein